MNNLLMAPLEVPEGVSLRSIDIEMERLPPQNQPDLVLDGFFKKVQEIEKLIDKLSKLLQELQKANENAKRVTKASKVKEINHTMMDCMDEVGHTARGAKSMIEELERANLSNRQKPGCGMGTGVDRSRTSTTGALKKRLKDKLAEFQALRDLIHQEHHDIVKRRVFTVTGAMPETEVVNRLVETGDGEQIFQKAIKEQGRGQIVDTLAEIHERHDAVRDLEKRLLELQQMFMDMAVLVDAQGDMLDNIESQGYFEASFPDRHIVLTKFVDWILSSIAFDFWHCTTKSDIFTVKISIFKQNYPYMLLLSYNSKAERITFEVHNLLSFQESTGSW